MSFHKLDKTRDKNFWSVRVSSDIRLIVPKTASSLLLCYACTTKNFRAPSLRPQPTPSAPSISCTA